MTEPCDDDTLLDFLASSFADRASESEAAFDEAFGAWLADLDAAAEDYSRAMAYNDECGARWASVESEP